MISFSASFVLLLVLVLEPRLFLFLFLFLVSRLGLFRLAIVYYLFAILGPCHFALCHSSHQSHSSQLGYCLLSIGYFGALAFQLFSLSAFQHFLPVITEHFPFPGAAPPPGCSLTS